MQQSISKTQLLVWHSRSPIVLVDVNRIPILGEVNLERFDVLVKAEGGHGPEEIVSVDGLALFLQALVRGFGRDEGNELGDALLDSLFGVFGNLCVLGECILHDAGNVGDREVAILWEWSVRGVE